MQKTKIHKTPTKTFPWWLRSLSVKSSCFFLLPLSPPAPSLFLSSPNSSREEKLQRQLVTLVTPAPSPEQLNNIVLKLSLLLNLIHPRIPPAPAFTLRLPSPVTGNWSAQHGISPGWGDGWGGCGDSKAETALPEQHRSMWQLWKCQIAMGEVEWGCLAWVPDEIKQKHT